MTVRYLPNSLEELFCHLTARSRPLAHVEKSYRLCRTHRPYCIISVSGINHTRGKDPDHRSGLSPRCTDIDFDRSSHNTTDMRFKIQPPEVAVPDCDPFKNDLLGRKESIDVLTHLVRSLEGPCVLAVDGAWGAGKTTFLRIWTQHLRNQGFPIAQFNAWETDFAGDPFVAISSELTKSVWRHADEPLKAKIERAKTMAMKLLRRTIPPGIRIATLGVLDFTTLIEKEVAQHLSSIAQTTLSEYEAMHKAVRSFNSALQDMASTLSQANDNRPLVLVIDELDRCRPSYAVQLLEVAKHLFSVDRIVFVLAVNRSELAHSIKALYGRDFDALGYLRRFIDLDFRLPNPDRKVFIDAMIDTININQYFARTADENARIDYENQVVRDWIKRFLGSSDLSCRQISQAIHRIGLVFSSLRSDQRSFAITAVLALIIRTFNLDLYHQFVRGEATDLDVVDRVFTGNSRLRTLQMEHSGCMFEVMTMLAADEIQRANEKMAVRDSRKTPLMRRYLKQIDSKSIESDKQKHARHVLDQLSQLVNRTSGARSGYRFGFLESVRRLELLSSALIAESPNTSQAK